MKKIIFYFALLVMFLGCQKSKITLPPVDDANLVNTTPISQIIMHKMEGIYKLNGGSKILGSEFVCKVTKNRVSFFSDQTGTFIVLKYGFKASDGSIQFSGFWRVSELPNQATIQFSISATEGATDLFAGIVANLKMKGVTNGNEIDIRFDRAFSQYTINNPLMIFAHHGVQNFADPPFAENSIKGVLNCESYGANGLEYDIRITSDKIPICIHDANINTRLTLKGPFTGTWDQYPFVLISEYIRLVDGQKVPSLEEALNTFVDSTSLKYFWMDIKGNTDIFKYLEPVVRRVYAKAVAKNRQIIIFAGLPDEDVITELKKQPTYNGINNDYIYSSPLPLLAEETVQKAIDNGCQFFGPRYTEGLLLEDVETAHSTGIKAITWTINSKTTIVDYLKSGKYDGFISDYPAYLVYSYYTMF